jgi:hypothetical protein
LKTTLATTVAALLIAAASVGGTVAPASAAMIVKHPPHWGQHQVCKISWDRHHHIVKKCWWVNNRK